MNKIKVLLAEDEIALAHIVRENLEDDGFDVTLCADGKMALKRYSEKPFDILVIDIMMPEMDGLQVAQSVRKLDKSTPIIFLTARSQVKDVVAGFESGANDYLKKPFSVEELAIRIKVLTSNNRLLVAPNPTQFNSGGCKIGYLLFVPVKDRLEIGTSIIQLTSRESEILKMLYLNRYNVTTRAEILKGIWGDDNFFNARSLDVFVTRLRRHLKADTNIQIINVRGVGYKLVW